MDLADARWQLPSEYTDTAPVRAKPDSRPRPQIENSWLQVLKFVKIREFYVIFKIRKNS